LTGYPRGQKRVDPEMKWAGKPQRW
jgi:hypothetical protein